MRDVVWAQKLGSELLRIERRVEAADQRRRARGVLGTAELSLCGCKDDAAEVCALRSAQVELRLLGCRIVTALEIVGEAQRKAVHRIKLGVDPLREFQVRYR